MSNAKRVCVLILCVTVCGTLALGQAERTSSQSQPTRDRSDVGAAPAAGNAGGGVTVIPRGGFGSAVTQPAGTGFGAARDAGLAGVGSPAASYGYVDPGPARYVNERTSFGTFNTYNRCMTLFELLHFSYAGAFRPYYFTRFFLNNEPILNREMLHYSLQSSVALSRQLAAAAAEMAQLLQQHGDARRAAAAVGRPQWESLMNRMRHLAGQIRKDEFLRQLDVRDSSKEVDEEVKNLDGLDPEQMAARLSALVERLGTQLETFREDARPAVVSVDTLSQPTFQSLARGIENLAKRLAKDVKI